MALPVRVGDILLAKVLALLALAVPITFLLFSVDAVVLVATGTGSVGLALALWLLLACALGFSTCGALLISLLARDFRTANNLNGALIVPSLLAVVVLGVLVPDAVVRVLLLAGLLAAGAALCLVVALRVVTFERLMR